MKFLSTTLIGFLLMSIISAAQDFEVLAYLPTTKEKIVQSEENIVNTNKERKLEDWVREAMK